MTEAAKTAKAIRTDLKDAFPGILFRVKSRNFSMGNAVDVTWVDGPTEFSVNALISKYQYGYFDGMTDMYEMSNCLNDIPQAKYVHGSRTHSFEAAKAALDTLKSDWNMPEDVDVKESSYGPGYNMTNDPWCECFQGYPSHEMWKVLKDATLPKSAVRTYSWT